MDTMIEEPQVEEKLFKQDLYYTIAQRIADGEAGDFVYCLHDGKVYFYQDGYWREITSNEFRNIIANKLLNKKGFKLLTKLTINQRKQVVENFKDIKYLPLNSFNTLPLINFENCMFDHHGNNVLLHKKEYFSTIRIPYKYDALAKCDLWVKTLEEILENDKNKINLIQEFFGYCLMPENEQKKGLLFLGDTDTGKSTIIDIFRQLIGEVNCSNVPLEYLSDPQWTPQLINKMVNIDPEVNKNAIGYEREFKIITGGKNEKVSCNQKHIPTFEFTPKCKIILSANIFPKIADHSSAFYQRLIIIPCERRFLEHEKDRTLHDKLIEELPGIFNWVVVGMNRLRTRGRFEQYDFMKDAVKELEDENNPVNLFFEENIEVDVANECHIEKGDLYAKYISWTISTNTGRLSLARFSSCVFKKYHKYTPKDTHHPESRKRIWRNLKYIEQKTNSINKGWQE